MSAPRVLLGVSCDFHDAAAAVLVDGELVAAAEEERFSRVKHDPSAPRGAIESVLRVAGVHAGEVDEVAFYERPVEVLGRFVASRRRQGPAGFPSFVRDAPSLVGRNLMVGYRIDRILRDLGSGRSPRIRYVDHHRSHAASAFLASPFESAAVLTVDGIGEWATATVSRGAAHRLDPLEELRYPDSVGLVYSFVTAYCGFEPNSDEYKLMGLAPYGEPRFMEALADLVGVYDDGSVQVDARRLGWYSRRGLRRGDLHRRFDGPPTRPGTPPSVRDADLAASVQVLTEQAMARLATHALEITGESDLCLAGGVALNCVANGRLVREQVAERLWVQPAAGDAGGAVGAALSVWHEHHDQPRHVDGSDRMRGAFLGPAVSGDEVRSWVRSTGLAHTVIEDRDELDDVVARRLAEGAIVGWFQGRMEFGPRALGHRSILADARRTDARRVINSAVKGREGFRPFAPAVLAERAPDWFDLDVASPYMLLVAPVLGVERPDAALDGGLVERLEAVRSPLPSCTHVDGSARVQTVDGVHNPRFRALLEAFERRTGCPVLLNTSFNVAGEPVVASPLDALASARRAGLDLLVVEDVLIESAAWEQAA